MPNSVYLILICFVLTSFIFIPNASVFYVISTFIVIFIYSYSSGIRDVGVDTESYREIYTNYSGGWITPYPLGFYEKIELGYANLINIFKVMGADFQLFSFFYTFILLLALYLFLVKCFNVKLASVFILLFVGTYTAYQLSFNQVRQFVSVVIVFMAGIAGLKKHVISSIILIFIASLFHVTALMFLCIFPLLRFIPSNDKLLLSLLFLMPFLKLLEPVQIVLPIINQFFPISVSSKVDFYMRNEAFSKQYPVNLTLIMSYIGLVFLFLTKNKVIKNLYEPKCKFFYNEVVNFLVVGYAVFFVISSFVVIAQRYLYYIDVFYVLAFSLLYLSFNRLSISSTFFVFIFIMFQVKTLFSSVSWLM